MTVEEFSQLPPKDRITLLKKNNLSYRILEKKFKQNNLNITYGAICDIINDKPNYSEETRLLVFENAVFLLMHKIDLNRFIYTKHKLFKAALLVAVRKSNFTPDDITSLLEIYKILDKYEAALNEHDNKKNHDQKNNQ